MSWAFVQAVPPWTAGKFLTVPEIEARFQDIPMDERHQQHTWTLPRALQKAAHTNEHIITDLRRHRHQQNATAATVNELKRPQGLGLWQMRQASLLHIGHRAGLLQCLET